MITGTKKLGGLGIGADRLDQVQARHAFYHPVQQDHVGIGFAQDVPGAVAALGLENLDDAEGLQDGDDELVHVGVVVHHENLQSVETVFTHHPRPKRPRKGVMPEP